MGDTLIQIDRSQAGIALLSMQRADKRNALNLALLEQLIAAIEQFEQDATCRVVIIRGEGPVFCAGLDLVEACRPDVSEKSAERIHRILTLIRETPLIVIGAAEGSAYAGGAGLLAACDLIVAAEEMRLGFPEVRRGLVAAIVSGVLATKVRDGDLRELLLVAEPITAARAQQIGLAQWVVPRDRVIEQAMEVAERILEGAPEAVRETKRLLNRNHGSVDFDALRTLHERIRNSDEAKEGLNAFREQRKPGW